MKHRNRDGRISSKRRQGIESGTAESARDNNHKRDLRASGLSLLPLALRPLLLFMVFGFFIFQTANVSAKSVTLTIPSDPLALTVTPGSGSVFKKSSAGTIRVATDSSYGYSLSIQSKTSNDLLNGSNKIASIVSALSESDYENSGNTNTWAYLPSKLGGSVNTNFQPGPTTEPTTLDRIESSSEGTDYGLTLAAKIDDTLPAGNYSNTFVLSATSNDPPYDDIIQNWSGCDNLPEETKTLNLLDIRDNKIYTVAKLKDGQCWMTKNLEIENKTLTPKDSDVVSEFELPASVDTADFNPKWEYDKSFVHIDDQYGGYYTWFAATAGEGKESVSLNGTNLEHSICPKGWRLPVLQDFIELDKALGGTGQNSQNDPNLVSRYMDYPYNFLMGGLYNGGRADSVGERVLYWSSSVYAAIGAKTLSVKLNGMIDPQSGSNKIGGLQVRCISRSTDLSMQNVDEWADSIKEGQTKKALDIRDNKYYTVSRLKDGKLWMTKNLEIIDKKLTPADSDIVSDFDLKSNWYSGYSTYYNTAYALIDYQYNYAYGGYYSWYAATAGDGTMNKSSGNVSHSICPKGWRLPTSSEYEFLSDSLGDDNDTSKVAAFQDEPNNFLMGGNYSGTSNYYRGSRAYYWSSTAYDSSHAESLFIDSSSINPHNRNEFSYKYASDSVRCVSRTDDLTMQNVNEWGSSIKNGETKFATDIRDGTIYSVARLSDDKLWMTDNLRIQNTTLTPTDSDVDSNFVLSRSVDRPNANSTYDSRELHIDEQYGGYYTWYTATAGEGTQQKSSDDVSCSICPKGWRLPTNNEYSALINAYNIGNDAAGVTILQSSPFYFKIGGLYTNGTLRLRDSYAHYWSSTALRATDAYILLFGESTVVPGSGAAKYDLGSVRCVSRE